MHDDMAHFIGRLQSVIRIYTLRDNTGQPLNGENPSSDARAVVAKLKGIRDELLDLDLEYELVENQFQNRWRSKRQSFFRALNLVHTLAGTHSDFPNSVFSRIRLENQFRAAQLSPEFGEPGRLFLEDVGRMLLNTMSAVSSAGVRNTDFDNAARELTLLMQELNESYVSLDQAASVWTNGFASPAQDYLNIFAKMRSNTTPWSNLDERLQRLLEYFELAAQASVPGGPGENGATSWGGVASSGSSSGG